MGMSMADRPIRLVGKRHGHILVAEYSKRFNGMLSDSEDSCTS